MALFEVLKRFFWSAESARAQDYWATLEKKVAGLEACLHITHTHREFQGDLRAFDAACELNGCGRLGKLRDSLRPDRGDEAR